MSKDAAWDNLKQPGHQLNSIVPLPCISQPHITFIFSLQQTPVQWITNLDAAKPEAALSQMASETPVGILYPSAHHNGK